MQRLNASLKIWEAMGPCWDDPLSSTQKMAVCGKELGGVDEAGETRSDSSPPVTGCGKPRSDARLTRHFEMIGCGKGTRRSSDYYDPSETRR